MRFLKTLAGLVDGAHARIGAELNIRESTRFEGVGRLAASVAHDFNNLLVPICASYDLLSRPDTIRGGKNEIVQQGQAASEQAKALVDKLLVRARSTEVKHEVVDVNHVLRTSEMLLRSFVKDTVRLSIDVPNKALPVVADRIELQQVFLNLTLNALSAVGNQGHVLIRLSQESESIRLSVEDDGPGIDISLRSWVLQPFNSTTPSGSGLGLATVARIAEAGRICNDW